MELGFDRARRFVQCESLGELVCGRERGWLGFWCVVNGSDHHGRVTGCYMCHNVRRGFDGYMSELTTSSNGFSLLIGSRWTDGGLLSEQCGWEFFVWFVFVVYLDR